MFFFYKNIQSNDIAKQRDTFTQQTDFVQATLQLRALPQRKDKPLKQRF